MASQPIRGNKGAKGSPNAAESVSVRKRRRFIFLGMGRPNARLHKVANLFAESLRVEGKWNDGHESRRIMTAFLGDLLRIGVKVLAPSKAWSDINQVVGFDTHKFSWLKEFPQG